MTTRRAFLKNTVLASAGTVVSFSEPRPNPRVVKKIIIAGAGIGGLCCGYELMKKGHEVMILEASESHSGHVRTGYDGLAEGLYADLGAEHITKPGYERFWKYTEEFNLTVLPYPRRRDVLRRIDGVFYTEEMLRDTGVLKKFGFNNREVRFLTKNPWWDLKSLFVRSYLDKFSNEYQPFGVGYDELDHIQMSEIYRKEGASEAALRFLGGTYVSALYELWQAGILHLRQVPLWPPDVYRIKGGNHSLPEAFALRLGHRIRLNSPVLTVRHGKNGVTVTYKDSGEETLSSADFLVVCIPMPAFRKVVIDPPLPAEKQFAVDHVSYDSYSRFVFQAQSKFWMEDNVSINIELDHPDIGSVWQTADEVNAGKFLLLGSGPGGVSPQRALRSFRTIYPGKHDTIEHVMSQDWTTDQVSPTCERLPFPIGTLNRFWPHVMTSHEQIYFAGAYADNLNWGMEAATRSANRVAQMIDQA